MTTDKQAIVQQREKAIGLKDNYFREISEFIALSEASSDQEYLAKLSGIHKSGVTLFNSYETLCSDSSLLGGHENEDWILSFAEDCHSILDTLLSHYQLLKLQCSKRSFDYSQFAPSKNAYKSMQRIVQTYLPDHYNQIQENLNQVGVTTNLGMRQIEASASVHKAPPKKYVLVLSALRDELEFLVKNSHLHWTPLDLIENDITAWEAEFVKGFSLIACTLDEMGLTDAAICATKAAKYWNPEIAVMIGICGGVKGKVRLGDLIAPDIIFHHHFGSFETDGFKRQLKVKNVSKALTSTIKTIAEDTTCLAEIYQNMHSGFSRPDNVPVCKVVPMSSADIVVKDKEYQAQIQDIERKACGIDMESYAFVAAMSSCGVESFVIKGVSDYANPDKDDSVRPYAKYMAANFTLKVLEEILNKKRN